MLLQVQHAWNGLGGAAGTPGDVVREVDAAINASIHAVNTMLTSCA